MAANLRADGDRLQVKRRGSVRRVRLALTLLLALAVFGWVMLQGSGPQADATAAVPLESATPTLVPGTGAIAGVSWQDQNGNGAPDPAEPALPGMSLTLTSQAGGAQWSVLAGADGRYRFDALAPGFYNLVPVPPAGYELTTPAALTVFVSAGAILVLDIGAKPVPTPTPTATPEPQIDIGSAAFAICGGVIHANTQEGTANVDRYGCAPGWAETGPELAYRVELGRNQSLTASLITTTVDLDLFLLTSSRSDSCVAAGDNSLAYDVRPGVYYLVVDGFKGAAGAFDLKLTCPLEPFQATPTPTYTPSLTPTASPTFTPGPTPTPTATGTRARLYLPVTLRGWPLATPTATPTSPVVSGWEQTYFRPDVHWRDIHFVGRSIGYAVGGPDWTQTGTATLIKTTDGGLSWTTSALITPSWMAGLDCKDAATCWVAGKSGSMLRTTDGAATWGTVKNLQNYVGYLVSAQWTGSGDTVLFGGSSGFVLRTPDGYNVSALQTGSGADQNDFACPVPGTCYAAAGSQGVLLSTDNGLTWALRSTGAPSPYFNSVACTDANTCWVAGARADLPHHEPGPQLAGAERRHPDAGHLQPRAHGRRPTRLCDRVQRLGTRTPARASGPA